METEKGEAKCVSAGWRREAHPARKTPHQNLLVRENHEVSRLTHHRHRFQ